MFYPNALLAVHKLTFLPARLVARENMPSPHVFSLYTGRRGGGRWIPVGPLKTDPSSIFYGIPFLQETSVVF